MSGDWVESIPSAWKIHRHVARWLTLVVKPAVVVDLGVDYGYSTFCFAQNLTVAKLDAAMVFGVDSFAGDKHTGFRHTLPYVRNLKDKHGVANVTLLEPQTFDEAARAWTRGPTVDILHVDGDHTFASTQQDLRAWLPHLRPETGVLLLHACKIRKLDFGVHRAINEFLEENDGFQCVYWELGSGLAVLTQNNALIDHLYRDYHRMLYRGPVQFPLDLVAEPLPATPAIYGFYHICAIYNFVEVVREQFAVIQKHGLLERTHTLFVSIVGPNLDDLDRARALLTSDKVRVIFLSTDPSGYERPILEFMQRQSFQFNEPALFYYLHSKGVSKQHQNQKNRCIAEWRQMMQFFLIEQWQACVAALATHCVSGVNWRTWPMPHFSGNFWWARSDYVATLPVTIGPDYYSPEAWLGQSRPSVDVRHTTELDHYFSPYPRSKYASIRETIVEILQKTMDLLEKHEIEYFLIYGTLLGWRREKNVIAHDDDGDLAVNGAFFTKLLGLKDEFEAHGLYMISYGEPHEYRKIIQVRNHPHQAVVDKDESGFVDLYQYEKRPNGILYCHWMSAIYLIKHIFPLKVVEFLEKETYVPHMHDAILEALYGDDFMTPRPGKKFSPVYDACGFAKVWKDQPPPKQIEEVDE